MTISDEGFWLQRFARIADLRDPMERVAAASAEMDAIQAHRELCSAVRGQAVLAVLKAGGRERDIVQAVGMSAGRVNQVSHQAALTKAQSTQLINRARRRAARTAG